MPKCIHKDGDIACEHKLPDMINLAMKRCKAEGCEKRPGFNHPDKKVGRRLLYIVTEKKGAYCFKHKKENMVDVKNKKCAHEGCTKQPNYNIEGEKVAKSCKDHKTDNMVDVTHDKCKHPKCMTRPTYNFPNETIGIYCNLHKKDNMVDVRSKICAEPDCEGRSLYNLKGQTKALYCASHKSDEMIDVKHKLCEYEDCEIQATFSREGCTKQPCFNENGETKGMYCNEHKAADMVNVKEKHCEFDGCKSRPMHGYVKPTHCTSHRLENMIKQPQKRCIECKKRALYGDKGGAIQIYCEQHKKPDSINFVERKCEKCNILNILNNNNLCCYCDEDMIAKNRCKEMSVKHLLEELHIEHQHNKALTTTIDKGCGTLRPDFVIDYTTHVVILEVDEFQHRSYACECEQSRMITITNAFGGIPVIWIRYNPDDFIRNHKIVKMSDAEKRKILQEYILKHTVSPPTNFAEVIYLFYDEWRPTDRRFVLIQYDK
eukprot:762478-Hanusia_phi.AAC.1